MDFDSPIFKDFLNESSENSKTNIALTLLQDPNISVSFPHSDAMIISWLDTFTSIVSGIVVFGIVGNIAHITGNRVEDMQLQGPQLTFITYPDAIAKFDAAQNVFAVLFFLMFFLLGLGSNTGIVTTIVTAVRDRFPQLPNWKVMISIAIYGFCCGLVYITPVGTTYFGRFQFT